MPSPRPNNKRTRDTRDDSPTLSGDIADTQSSNNRRRLDEVRPPIISVKRPVNRGLNLKDQPTSIQIKEAAAAKQRAEDAVEPNQPIDFWQRYHDFIKDLREERAQRERGETEITVDDITIDTPSPRDDETPHVSLALNSNALFSNSRAVRAQQTQQASQVEESKQANQNSFVKSVRR